MCLAAVGGLEPGLPPASYVRAPCFAQSTLASQSFHTARHPRRHTNLLHTLLLLGH
jgi:hypothetical protein